MIRLNLDRQDLAPPTILCLGAHAHDIEMGWNTFRDHLIPEYEIPKYDGDLGQPNVFVPLEMEVSRKKVRFIMDTFQSQRGKHWFEATTFFSLMRLRGIECRAAGGHAEAFYCRKLVL